MRKIIAILVILVVAGSLAFASSLPEERPDQWNGEQWQEMTEEQREYFVAGTAAASNEILAFMLEDDFEEITFEDIQEKITEINEYYEGKEKETTIMDIIGQF